MGYADSFLQSLVERLRAISTSAGSETLNHVSELVEVAIMIGSDNGVIDGDEYEAVIESL